MSDAPVDRGQPILETTLVAPEGAAPPAGAGPRLTAGGVVARTLRVWWANVWAFSAMSLVATGPLLAGVGLFSWSVLGSVERGAPAPDGAALARMGAGLALGAVLTLVLSVVQLGAVTYGTVCWLNGERASLGGMVRAGVRRGLPVVGTGFLVWLGAFAGTLLLVVPGVVFVVAACVALPAAVVERPGVVGALRRSFDLTRGSRWQLLAAGLVIVVLQWLLSAAVQAAFVLLASAIPPAWALGASVVAAQLGNAVFSVLTVVAVAVCYHDLRLAREGVDTAALARVFE